VTTADDSRNEHFDAVMGRGRGHGGPDGIQRLRAGERFEVVVAHSEVAVHMGVAGQRMTAVLLGGPHPMVQLLDDGGYEFSAPVLPGEAGVYRDQHGFYVHAP
jgi:hypothetical protein